MEKSFLDILWIIVAASLVFMMQGGFLCLESGLTRSKNSINVAIKNVMDFGLAVLLYWLFGFGLMFGFSQGGWIGTINFITPIESEGPWLSAFFLFQVMFCATAATIVSGAVAERIKFSSYMIITVVISGIIYPIYGHWAWGGVFGGPSGWLSQLGFVDFAGSSVVHSVGGWVALAVLMIIGARSGRFPKEGPPNKITGNNLPMALFGVLLLFFGWFGFNGGSTLGMDKSVPAIITNTLLAGSSGMITTLIVGWIYKRVPDVLFPMNGTIAGLVSITANCHAVSAVSAVMIGAVGGLVMLGVSHLLERFKIDDVVGAIPAHMGAGIWGTLAVAFFGKPEILDTGLTFGGQLLIQTLGVVVCAIFSFGTAYIIFKMFNSLYPLRVSPEDEQMGLNVVEHGASTEIHDLLEVMEIQAVTKDVRLRVPVEPFTEIGQIARLYNTVMDGLDEAKEYVDNIIRSMIDLLIVVNPAGKIQTVNQSVLNLFGYQEKELIGQPFSMLFLENESVIEDTRLVKLIQEGIIKDYEIACKTKSGDEISMSFNSSVMKNKDNRVLGIVGIARDVRERKHAEELFRLLMESSPSGTLIVNEDGKIVLVNKMIESLFGYTKKELIGESVELLLPKEKRQEHVNQRINFNKISIRSEMGKGRALTGMRKDGKVFPVEIWLNPINTKEGRRVIASVADITDRVQIQENEKQRTANLEKAYKDLEDLQDMLIQAEKLNAIGQLASGVAHEVRNPLAIIMQGINYLKQTISPEEKDAHETLAMLKDGVVRADKIIVTLLDFSKSTKINLQLLDIDPILENSLKLVKSKLNDIGVVWKFKKDLPKVLLDRNKIEQVFINSLLNSIQAMHKEGTLTIRSYSDHLDKIKEGVSSKKEDFFSVGDKVVIIEIEDTGGGIPKENMKKIWEPFFTTKQGSGGTGLGLSVSRKIIAMHKALMEVESQEGKGTKIIYTFKVQSSKEKGEK